jgi:hypothetical protein
MAKRLSAMKAAEQIRKWVTNEDSADSDTGEGSSIIESSDSEGDVSTPLQAARSTSVEDEAESSQSSEDDEQHQLTQQQPQKQHERQPQPQNERNVPATYISKNGNIIWNASPPPSSQVRAANIRHAREGPIGAGKMIESEADAFKCFFDDRMLQMIVTNTNQFNRFQKTSKGKNADDWKPIDVEELKGVIGILFMLGVYRSQHESLRSLWSLGMSGRAIFPAAFSSNRFQEILSCLRFDNRDTRAERRQVDKFASFREL